MTTTERLEEAIAHFLNLPFTIQELAEKAQVSEPTARAFAMGLPIKKIPTGSYFFSTGEDLPRNPEDQKPGEIQADLYVMSYLKGFDQGFQKGFDCGHKKATENKS